MTPDNALDIATAARAFADLWANDDMLSLELAPKLTCTEYGVLRDLFEANGDRLDLWDEAHADGDCEPSDCMHEQYLARRAL